MWQHIFKRFLLVGCLDYKTWHCSASSPLWYKNYEWMKGALFFKSPSSKWFEIDHSKVSQPLVFRCDVQGNPKPLNAENETKLKLRCWGHRMSVGLNKFMVRFKIRSLICVLTDENGAMWKYFTCIGGTGGNSISLTVLRHSSLWGCTMQFDNFSIMNGHVNINFSSPSWTRHTH